MMMSSSLQCFGTLEIHGCSSLNALRPFLRAHAQCGGEGCLHVRRLRQAYDFF